MKMTLHIDEKLLKRVMIAIGVTSKTRAIDVALRELDRRTELKRLAEEGLGLTPEGLKDAFEEASGPGAARNVAERRARYGGRPRPRR